MIEALKVIAMLCAINGPKDWGEIAKKQNECHAQYIKCMRNTMGSSPDLTLVECVLKRHKY